VFIRFKDTIINTNFIITIDKIGSVNRTGTSFSAEYLLVIKTHFDEFRGQYASEELLNAAFDHLQQQIKSDSFHIEGSFVRTEIKRA
jgi:hypothetical protein